MKTKILELLDDIQRIKQKPEENLKISKNVYYLNDDILCLPDGVCDARYPYEIDGMNLWVHSNGHIDINEGILTIIKPIYFNESAAVGFWGGIKLNETQWFPISVTNTNKQLFEPLCVDRYTIFSKRCAYFIADTEKVVFATRANITSDKKICFTSVAINKTKDKIDVYLSTFLDFMLANTDYRNNWSSMGFFGKLYENNLYRIYTNENNAVINRTVVSANDFCAESTISRNSFMGGTSNNITNAESLKEACFAKEKKSVNTTDIPAVADIVKMTINPYDSVCTSYLITVTKDFVEDKNTGANGFSIDKIEEDIVRQELIENEKLSHFRIDFQDMDSKTIKKDVFNKFLKNVQKQVDVCATGKNYVGALIGVRDIFQQLETSVFWNIDLTKEKIVKSLNYIFSNGRAPRQFSVNHEKGESPVMDIREFIDQGLWIINTVYNYICTTDDYSILDKKCSYYDMIDEDRQIWKLGEETTVYEHLTRIMEYLISNIDADTNCLKINFGDWNDAITALGKSTDNSQRFGSGVSVMATLQLYGNLLQMSDISEKCGQAQTAETYREYSEKIEKGLLKHAVVDAGRYKHIVHGWGDKQKFKICTPCDFDGEFRYSATAFSFWAISGMINKTPEMKDSILNAYNVLDSKYGVRTFVPYFNKDAVKYVGNIANITKGTYENSCTYIHSTMFSIMALFILGESKKAWEQIEKVIPITHEFISKTPFVMPNSYCYNEEFGMDGESLGDWYTGSGCVLLRNIVKYAFGVQPDLNGLKILTASYMPTKHATLVLNIKGHRTEFVYKNQNSGKRKYFLNGNELETTIDEVSGCKVAYIENAMFVQDMKIEIVD